MSILREGRGHCLFFFHGPSNTESQKCLFNFYLYLVWGCRKLPGPTLLPVSMELTGAVSGSKENVRSREGAEVGAVIMVRIEAVDQRDRAEEYPPFEGLNGAAGRGPGAVSASSRDASFLGRVMWTLKFKKCQKSLKFLLIIVLRLACPCRCVYVRV